MSEQLKFFKGNENALDSITKIPGGIYHCQDTGNTYLAKDNGELELYSTTLSFSTDEAYDASVPLDADTLNGYKSDDFVKQIDLNSIVYADNLNIQEGNIKTLYDDKNKTEAIFPRTKTKAITNDDGVSLDTLLNNNVNQNKLGPINLLDNSDFRNPINQTDPNFNCTVYSSGELNDWIWWYMFDRWCGMSYVENSYLAVIKENNYLSFNNSGEGGTVYLT